MKTKKTFNPNQFDTNYTVKDVAKQFKQLLPMDFNKISLADEIAKLNYEVISKGYEDFKYNNIVDYYNIKVDTIV